MDSPVSQAGEVWPCALGMEPHTPYLCCGPVQAWQALAAGLGATNQDGG